MRNIQKKQYCINFLNSMIADPQFKPFLYFDDLVFGFFDFQHTARHAERNGLSLIALHDEVLHRKHFSYQWMCGELRKIFGRISDYLLSDDPLQMTCKMGMKMITSFENQYIGEFKKKRSVGDQERLVQQPTLKDQIEMVFYLKSYEHDEETLRKIGEVCQILQETEEEYVFDLNLNSFWEAMIGKYNR